MTTSSEAVLLQVPFVKHKKDDGNLYLMSERLAWIQGNRDTVTLSHRYADIKSQKISPEGKPKIQLQIVLHNNASFTFHFVNPEGARAQFEARNQVKELLIQLLPKFRRQADQELAMKTKILSEHPALLQLYKDLVTDGIIGSDEFWSVHAPQYVQSRKPVQSQDVGVESGFLSGIQPETDGSGLRYNITTDIIESIFKTYPAVRKKHLELVPAQLTEAQFWTKFFQSHYFHRDRMPVSKDVFSDCAKADDKEMRKELEKVKEANSKVISILEDDEVTNPDKETTSNSADSSKNSKTQSISATGVLKTIIKRFNQHSIMVLKACDRAQPNEEKSSVPAEGEEDTPQAPKKAKLDLDSGEPEFPEFQEVEDDVAVDVKNLNLVETDRFLTGLVGDQQEIVPQEAVMQSWVNMRAYADRWALKPQLMDAKTAGQILQELSPGGALMKVSQKDGVVESLPPDVEAELKNVYVSLGELLRHFWNCFPVTSTALQEKLKKTHGTLKKFEMVKIQHLTDVIRRSSDRLNVSHLLAHLNAMLQQADSKYQTWLQRSQKLK